MASEKWLAFARPEQDFRPFPRIRRAERVTEMSIDTRQARFVLEAKEPAEGQDDIAR